MGANDLKSCGHESPDTFKIVQVGGKFKARPVQCILYKEHKTDHHYETEWPR